MSKTTMDKVVEFLDDLGYDENLYDVDSMATDIDNGNLELDRACDLHDYFTRTIVANSIINGQHRQAKTQADQYGLNYELIKYQTSQGDLPQ